MHWRRLASFLLGAWLMAMALVVTIVSHNMRAGGTVLPQAAPRALEIAQSVGDEPAHMLMRYQLSEQARLDLERFEWLEIAIGVTLVLTLFMGTHATKLVSAIGAAMVVLTVFLQLFIGPEIAYLGRELDFVSPLKMSGEHNRLLALQGAYLGMTGVKFVLGAALAWYLLTFRVQPRHADFA